MPDPKYGMPPHYLYGSGTPAEYNAGVTTAADYKAAPHLAEYQWNHPRERHRLPDDLVIMFSGLGNPARENPELPVLTATKESPGQDSEVIHLEVVSMRPDLER